MVHALKSHFNLLHTNSLQLPKIKLISDFFFFVCCFLAFKVEIKTSNPVAILTYFLHLIFAVGFWHIWQSVSIFGFWLKNGLNLNSGRSWSYLNYIKLKRKFIERSYEFSTKNFTYSKSLKIDVRVGQSYHSFIHTLPTRLWVLFFVIYFKKERD